MNTKIEYPLFYCPFCKEMVNIFCRSYDDLPMWNFSTGKPDKKNKDKIILIHCKKCEAIFGSYKK